MATAVSAIHHQMESEDQAQIMEMVPTLHSVCQAKTSADTRGNLYSYGKFENIRSFEECAEKCVKDSPLELINDGVFRGFDFDCHFEECNCLFDRGSLDNSRNRHAFDRTNRREPGTGTADRNGGPAGRGWYCGTLVGFMESELATSRRALRGGTY